MAAGGLLSHGTVDPRRADAVPDERAGGAGLVRLPLPADGLDRSVPGGGAVLRGRSTRAHAAGCGAVDIRARAAQGDEARRVVAHRLVDRRRLGALFP